MDAPLPLFQNHTFVYPQHGKSLCSAYIVEISLALLARGLKVPDISVEFGSSGHGTDKTKYMYRITGPDFVISPFHACQSVVIDGYNYDHYQDDSWCVRVYTGTDFCRDLTPFSYDHRSPEYKGALETLCSRLNVQLQKVLDSILLYPSTEPYALPIVPLKPVPPEMPRLYLYMTKGDYYGLQDTMTGDGEQTYGAKPTDRLVPVGSKGDLPTIVYDAFLVCRTMSGNGHYSVEVCPLYCNEIYVADWYRYENFWEFLPPDTGILTDAQADERQAARADGFVTLESYVAQGLQYRVPTYLFRRELELDEIIGPFFMSLERRDLSSHRRPRPRVRRPPPSTSVPSVSVPSLSWASLSKYIQSLKWSVDALAQLMAVLSLDKENKKEQIERLISIIDEHKDSANISSQDYVTLMDSLKNVYDFE